MNPDQTYVRIAEGVYFNNMAQEWGVNASDMETEPETQGVSVTIWDEESDTILVDDPPNIKAMTIGGGVQRYSYEECPATKAYLDFASEHVNVLFV